MRLYFVRHGESVANLLRQFSNRGIEHPLTERGVEQAQSLANQLVGIHFEIIYTSPLLRAMQTAQILADRLHVPVEGTEALREWSVGIYEGTTDPEGWELHRQVQEDWFSKNNLESRMPGGESFIQIKERFIPFAEGLIRKSKDTDNNILCVSHGGLYLAMLPIIFKNIDHTSVVEQGFPHTTLTVAEVGVNGLYCTVWCGTPILARP